MNGADDRELRIGLVGVGVMGRNHARVLSSLPGVRFAGVADKATDIDLPPLPVRPAIVSSISELLRLGVDACVVAASTDAHAELVQELAGAGVHVLVEKPLAPDAATGRRIRKAIAAAGVVGAVGHIERFNPALQQMRRRLQEGQIGEIYQISTRRQSPFPARVADVGVVFDLATHDVDLTAWVSGQRYDSVSARTANKSGRAHEDLVAIVGQLTDGTVTNHLVNWLSPFKERVTVAVGERGCFVADTLSAELTFHENGAVAMEWDALSIFKGVSQGDAITYAFPKPEPLRSELEAFVAAIRTGDDADLVTIEDGLHAVETATAVLRSAELGTSVAV